MEGAPPRQPMLKTYSCRIMAVLIATAASSQAAVPPNDEPGGAIVLTGTYADVNGDTTNATAAGAYDETLDGWTLRNSVWFEWTAPASGELQVSAQRAVVNPYIYLSVFSVPSAVQAN